jgi:serine/threonine-protein kinase
MTEPPAGLAAALADRYRLERELGRGGMATVWLAQDVRHGRQVAVKVLHPELGAVLGVERFLAEIRTTAHLSHPGILPLFDSGTAAGQVFYVMPYVPGESLRARMDREGQLPVGDAVRIAIEVAEALAHAHGQGVIHRDIKPENILLQGGHPLLADFGIALAVQEAGGSRLTQTGLSLGTPQYMSPEQAGAERIVDGRSDIYSLGAVLYEMLAGVPPFSAPTTQAVLVKLMTEEPKALGTLRKSVPDHVADAVHTALEKLPADRFATPTEFAQALGRAAETSSRRAAGRAAAPPRRRATILAAGAAGLVLGGIAGLLATRALTRPPALQPPSHLAILAENVGGSGSPALRRQLAFTPDGESLLFVVVNAAGVNELMRQRLDAPDATRVPGSNGLAGPTVSPDGRWLYGSGAEGAYRMPLQGGPRTRLPEEFFQAAVAPDGTLWFSGTSAILRRIRPGADSVETPFGEGRRLEMQQLLDDRTAIALSRVLGTASGFVFLLDLERGDTTRLLDVPVVEARWTAGHLVWVLPDGSLVAATHDLESGQRGPSFQVATGVSLTGTGIAQVAVASNGTVAYIPESPRSLTFVNLEGASRPAFPEARNFHAPLFSPDGRRLSFDFTSAEGRDSWVLDLAQGTLTRASFAGDGHDATWAPDGRHLTYVSARSGALGVYRIRPGGSGVAESLFAAPELTWTGEWLADGSGLVTTAALSPGSTSDIALLAGGGSGPLRPIVATPFNEQYPALSPDGRWLAYVSNQSGPQQVYVRPFPGTDADEAVQVSLDGGTEPAWSPDGRHLAYRSTTEGHPELMLADVSGTDGLTVTARRALFPIADYIATAPHANYDWMPDGRGFVMVQRGPSTRIMVIQNLPGLVRRLQGAAAR